MKRTKIGEKLAVLAKTIGRSQTSLAEKVGVPPSQINRFFRGHSDIYTSALLPVMRELGFDLEEMISKKIKVASDLDSNDPKTVNETLVYLFNELDDLGKQTMLAQLLWAAKIAKGDQLPIRIEEQIRKEFSLI